MTIAHAPFPGYGPEDLRALGFHLAERYATLVHEGVPAHLAMPLRRIQVQEPKLTPLPSARALIVEDDPHVRVLAELVLDDIAVVVGCESAESALAVMRARGNDIAFVFSDVRLAGTLSGFELARTVVSRWPATRMVLTSGMTGEPSEAVPDGVAFLAKPWRCADLRAVAQTMIRRP